MSLTIVAIPREDDYVWKISSEKVPHMTILNFGDDTSKETIDHITDFLEHSTNLMLNPFGMSVDRRGELGDKKADVLFFEKDWQAKNISDFRTTILQDLHIKGLYRSVDQFPEWTPHLTLGYPESPAKPDPRDFTRFHWVEFDKIAFWIGDFSGPEFSLKSQAVLMDNTIAMTAMGRDFIEHHGIKGQKWGVRRSRKALEREARRSEDSRRHNENAKKPLSELSDKDLKDLHNRLNTEKNVRQLQGQGKSAAGKIISDLNKSKGQIVNLVGPAAAAAAGGLIKKGAVAAAITAGGLVAVRLMDFPEVKFIARTK